MVDEMIQSGYEIESIIYTAKWKEKNTSIPVMKGTEQIEISENELSRVSNLKTPPGIIAIAKIPNTYFLKTYSLEANIILGLMDIQDPGNLGTIIRTADWFGIKHILCSSNTADVYNPKVVQSTMGAIFRVNLVYLDLQEEITAIRKKHPHVPVLAAVLDGENLYNTSYEDKGILLMGNESKGLSEDMIRLATHKVFIPRLGNLSGKSESLNVSVATSIILSEIKRQQYSYPR